MHSLTSHFRHVLFWRRCRWWYCGNLTPVSLLSTSLHVEREPTGGPDISESISTSKLDFVPRASTVSRRLHCSPVGFLRTDLHLSKPRFVPSQVLVRRCISSPPVTTDPSVRQLGCSHFMIGDQREYRFTKHAQKRYIRSSEQILEWRSAVGSHCES